jgi:hypothetical protein
MRKDQGNTKQGFGTVPMSDKPGARMLDQDRLVDRIEFRVTSRDDRRLNIMFHQHRQDFGWQVPSDMYRELMIGNLADYEAKVKKPSPEMMRMRRRSLELQRSQSEAFKHRDLDAAIEQIDTDIELTFRAGDLAGVRRILAEFKEQTKAEDDPAVKIRREVEYDKRWSRIDESINRGVSLVNFVDEE